MIYVLGVILAIGTVLLAVGALTGRVKATHACCAAAAGPDSRLDEPPAQVDTGRHW
jgi:uncharacterized membrane protein YjjP (DUF1212 family)